MEHRALTPSGFGFELPAVSGEGALDAFHASGGLLLYRGQTGMTPRELRRFAARFGRLELNDKYDEDFLLPGFPEILRLGNLRENGRYRSLFIEADAAPLLWHSDDSFRSPQPIGSCLLCIETPSTGGETGFAGMAAAYEALSPQQKERIEGLTAVHSYDHLNEVLRRKNPHRPPLSAQLREEHPPVRRPIVSRHPVTNERTLFVPKSHIESIDGLEADETESLLTELVGHVTGSDFAYMHQWKPGDLVVWDNRAALHAPTPFDASRYQRLLYRLTMLDP